MKTARTHVDPNKALRRPPYANKIIARIRMCVGIRQGRGHREISGNGEFTFDGSRTTSATSVF